MAALERRLRTTTDPALLADLQLVLVAVQGAQVEDRDSRRRIGDPAVVDELNEARRELVTAPAEAVTAAARSLEALLKGLLGDRKGALGDLVKAAKDGNLLPTQGAVAPVVSAILSYVAAVRNQNSDAHHVAATASSDEARFVVHVAASLAQYIGSTARPSSQNSSPSS